MRSALRNYLYSRRNRRRIYGLRDPRLSTTGRYSCEDYVTYTLPFLVVVLMSSWGIIAWYFLDDIKDLFFSEDARLHA